MSNSRLKRLLGASGAGGSGKKTAALVVGTSLSGHTLAEVDYLCDGEDDQEEINAAIQDLPEGGGKVVVREGTYSITANIIVDVDSVTIEGMDASTVLKRMYDDDAGVRGLVRISGNYATAACLRVDGNKAAYSGTGIYVSDSNCKAIGNACNGNGVYGINIGGASSDNVITGNACCNNGVGIV